MYTYGEIPDSSATKQFIPIMRHIYRIFQVVGIEYLEKLVQTLSGDILYELFKLRLNSSIESAKAIIDGKFRLGCYYSWEKEGIPNPAMTLGLRLPDLKNKRVYSDEKFEWIYPMGKRITLTDLNMDVEEGLNGILTDINQDFPIDQIFTRSHIISTGIGTTTKFWDQRRKNP